MKEWEVPQVPEWGEANRPKAIDFLVFSIATGRAGIRCRRQFSIADITGLFAIDFMKPARIDNTRRAAHVLRWHQASRAGRAPRPDVKGELDALAPASAPVDLPRHPLGAPLPHEPRPVVVPSSTARVLIAGQAPGTKVHFGRSVRRCLRRPAARLAGGRREILRSGNCHRADGFLLSRPRRQGRRPAAAPGMRAELAVAAHGAMPQIELVLAVGLYAQAWHIGGERAR